MELKHSSKQQKTTMTSDWSYSA